MSELVVDSVSIAKATSTLLASLPEGYLACVRGRSEVTHAMFRTFVHTPEQAAAQIVRYVSPPLLLDVTFCISLVDKIPPANESVSEENSVGVLGFGFDLDIQGPVHANGKNYPPTVEEAIECLPLEPTWIVHSGNGLHVWHLFDEAYLFDDEDDKQRVKRTSEMYSKAMRAKAASAGAWDLDPTFDLARGYRIPGTINFKGDTHKPVRWLRDNGPIWNYLDFEDFASENLVAYLGKEAKLSRFPTEQLWKKDKKYLDLQVTDDRRFDPDKLKKLFETDNKFRLTYLHQRDDIPDHSPSGYDFSLALTLLDSKFSLQEVVDLLIDCRAFHKIPFRDKYANYYRRTIWNAEQLLKGPDVISIDEARQKAKEKAEAEAKPEEPAPKKKPGKAKKATAEPPPADSPKEEKQDPQVLKGLAAQQLSNFFGLKVLRLDKIMTEEPSYKIHFEGGKSINVPDSTHLRSQAHMSNIFFAKMSHDMPQWDKKKDWPRIYQLYIDAEVEVAPTDPEATEESSIESYLTAYLFDVPYSRTPEEFKENPEQPLIDEDLEISISGPHFREWLRDRKKVELTIKQMSPAMLNLGCPPVARVRLRSGPESKRTQVYRWILPEDKFDAAAIIDHRNNLNAMKRTRFARVDR